MKTEEEIQPMPEAKKESGIDFGKLWKDVKKHKSLYFKVLPITFVLAVVYTLGIPNTYQCTVKLAPELSSRKSSSSLSSLASTFGLNLSAGAGGEDALFPTLYPELMNSVSFHASLFPIKVHRQDDAKEMTYYDYLLKEQKTHWLSKAKKAVFGLIFGSGDNENESSEVNTFQLTKKQTLIEQAIGRLIVCDVDKKTMVITINVTDQDPLIAATMADSVRQRLQDFITDYRTRKARVDVEYYTTLYKEAKERYEKALNDYASFSDHNQKVFLQSVRSQQTKLETELGLQQQVYSQMASQLQMAEAKLQEEKPAFTTLDPATVPIKKSAPSRAKICLIWLFLAFLGTTAYVFYKEDDLKSLLGMGGEEE